MNFSFVVGVVFGYRYSQNIHEFLEYCKRFLTKKKKIQIPDFDAAKFNKT